MGISRDGLLPSVRRLDEAERDLDVDGIGQGQNLSGGMHSFGKGGYTCYQDRIDVFSFTAKKG